MDWLKGFYQTAFDAARKNRVLMPKFEQFWADNKPITFKATEKRKNGYVMKNSVTIRYSIH
ncbi:trimethylamine-N-oxide reductase 2 [Actinobacillus equuli]|nr:trimethylamine-N-oxide reductase 2 [Actinobacillus equuli]